uniref:ABC transporter permease n=1 Tax=Strongyloides venezuelensis TaxID=75913 RepID=A0A0K0FVS4_STRVS
MLQFLKRCKFNTIKIYIYFIILLILLYLGGIIFFKDMWKTDYDKNENICMKEKLNAYKNLESEMIKQQERVSLGFTSKTIFKNTVINLFEKIDSCHRTNESVKVSQLNSYQTAFFIFSLLSIPIFILLAVEIYELMTI